MTLLHGEFAKAPPPDAADFYAGFSDGLEDCGGGAAGHWHGVEPHYRDKSRHRAENP
jgi:hypothetical protein